MSSHIADTALRWRLLDAVDEWAHRRKMGKATGQGGRSIWPGWWRLTPFPFLCDLRDAHLLGLTFREVRRRNRPHGFEVSARSKYVCLVCGLHRRNSLHRRSGSGGE
jgi:hypothetical protein